METRALVGSCEERGRRTPTVPKITGPTAWFKCIGLAAILMTMVGIFLPGRVWGDSLPPAKPGDLVICFEGLHGGWGHLTTGIPHMGIYDGNDSVIHVQVKPSAHIESTSWLNQADFKDPGFFSVLDSPIPISYQGKIVTMADLLPDVKDRVREDVVKEARAWISVDFKYAFGIWQRSNNCGDWALMVYDMVLKHHGITVMSHRYPKPRRLVKARDLVPGELRDYAELLGYNTDPARLYKWLKQVARPSSGETSSESDRPAKPQRKKKPPAHRQSRCPDGRMEANRLVRSPMIGHSYALTGLLLPARGIAESHGRTVRRTKTISLHLLEVGVGQTALRRRPRRMKGTAGRRLRPEVALPR